MKRTSQQWAELVPAKFNLKIIDPDGWDRTNLKFSFYDELITGEEFMNRVANSAISVNRDIFTTEWEFEYSDKVHPNHKKVTDLLSKFLNEKKHKFGLVIISGTGYFTVYHKNEELGIMVECAEDGQVTVKYYAESEGKHNHTDLNEEVDDPDTWDPEPSFMDFMDNYKEVMKIYGKIQGHLNKIYGLCLEHNMDFDDFLTIEHPELVHPSQF